MLAIGATIGILGGGQLGRMLALAAARLGFRVHIFADAADAPAVQVAGTATIADFTDRTALAGFADSVDVITFEFENIPIEALDFLESQKPILPNRRALAVSQDRLAEKDFLRGLGVAVAPYHAVDNAGDMEAALSAIGVPSILKTRRFGYDGKGQSVIKSESDGLRAFADIGAVGAVLEGFVEFSKEISVIGARGASGGLVCFDIGENRHENGILRETRVPAGVGKDTVTSAVILCGQIMNALDYIGVLGVELFVTEAGLLVNEIAPRVHNSGHWTQDGCAIDQFEQHIRAIVGWSLGDGARHSDVIMTNLIGDDVLAVSDYAGRANACVHLYGKAEARAGRKMGHVNLVVSC